MFRLLIPDIFFKNIYKITPEILSKLNIKAVILDIDDTILAKKSSVVSDELIVWVKNLKSKEIPVYLSSNNIKKRVMPISKRLDLPFISLAFKPFPGSIKKIEKIFNIPKKNLCIIGDQMFTDMIAGNLAGVKTILVDPLSNSHGVTVRLKRLLEKPIRKRLKYYSEYI